LRRDALASAEPALAHVRDKLVGGLRLPNDETGDCQLFTARLTQMARDLGVKFEFDTTIRSLEIGGGAVRSVQTDKGPFTADRYVLALGSYSRFLLDKQFRVPVYPMKGYSITVPIVDAARAPVSTILDETYKIAVTRFDDRIRVGGMAEISGYTTDRPDVRRATLIHALEDFFPGAGDHRDVPLWSGLRPMTPDGPPIVGATGLANLFLNTGHGTLGWTMACGSGRLLADLMSGKPPEIAFHDLSLERYR
jgi:D-amino-acid dehydrogenase